MSVSSVITKIGTQAKSFINKDLPYKVLGGVTLASVAYDAYSEGRDKSLIRDKLDTADRFETNYKQSRRLHKPSQTLSDMKDAWFDVQQTFSIYHIVSKLSGYFEGISKTILGNLPEIGLSLMALNTKNHKVLGKASGVLLALNAAKTILYEVIGLGSDNK